MLMHRAPVVQATRNILESLTAQYVLHAVVAVLLPGLIRFGSLDFALTVPGFENSLIGALAGVGLALLMVRRVTAFPGTRAFRYILPSFAGAFGLVLGVIFAFRLDYSRLYFFSCLATSITLAFLVASYLLNRSGRRYFLVPGIDTEGLELARPVEWVPLTEPRVPTDRSAVIAADFRRDHGPEWERMLAEAAVQGHPVYHFKQLLESLTGRVTIEHLSENSFGSLLPNLAWRKAKRLLDLVAALVALPVLLPVLLIVGIAVRLDSPGPAFFRQWRMGAAGRPFRVIKFRTMTHRPLDTAPDEARAHAMTQSADARITRLGRHLRRSRIDELPQILNVLVGQMSWIGPRPEAIPLSRWYEAEIPFYLYRHIVRPGITGWAQVNQGHVHDIAAVTRKLQYDFYYIKNFSVWMDMLIAIRTVRILLTGFGSK